MNAIDRGNTVIRKAEIEDADCIVGIMNQVAEREPVSVDTYVTNVGRRSENPGLSLVVIRDGELVGYGETCLQHAGTFFLKVYVKHEHQRKGIGQNLYEELLAYALKNGARRVELTVLEEHAETLAWAIRRGFQEEYRTYISTLDLTNWSPQLYSARQEKAKAMGIRMTSLGAEMNGEQLEHGFAFVQEAPDVPVRFTDNQRLMQMTQGFLRPLSSAVCLPKRDSFE